MSKQAGHFYEFDSFRLDVTDQTLLRSGVPVPLSPKLFQTLLALVQNSGRVVEKEDLIRHVWPDTFVEENNLSQYISVLRRSLGDGRHEQRYIETVPRRGYRFAVDVCEVWNGDGHTLGETHTKVSLSVKEEIEEGDERESQYVNETARLRNEAAPRLLGSKWLTSALLVLAAAGFSFGLYQLIGAPSRPVTTNESAGVPVSAPVVQAGVKPAKAFIIKTFDPSVWPRTDAEIGVEGFQIEDFEDVTLVEGLQIELSDSATDNFGPTAKLPLIFNPEIDDTGGARVFVAGVWDGARVHINRRTSPPHGYEDYVWGDVTFHVPEGASSFGFSLHDMDRNTELTVNSNFLVDLRRLLPSGTTRSGYVRIDAAPGQTIFSVKVANSVTETTGDALVFDHVAFKPLPRGN
jgi:DNA-binding winged helix-turn-helix (wHTH) protein